LQQHACKARVVELEVPLVVELEEGRTVRVVLLQVDVVQFRLLGREAAVLANVHLLREKIKSRLKLINIRFSLKKKLVMVCLF